ncbi:MAG: hypothetical protein JWM67_462 [Mycobacterium sp.]|nr:hypothetical protein [Mycobacterium sp.]
MVYKGVYGVLLALHLITVVFIVGPLVFAASSAPRLLRGGAEAVGALQNTLRAVRLYSALSLLTVILGTGLVSIKSSASSPHTDWDFGDPWIGASYVLWLIAVAVSFLLIGGGLQQGITELQAGRPAGAATGKVAAGAGVASLCWLAIVVLMVFKFGS